MASLVCNLQSVFPTSAISQFRASTSRVLLHQLPILACRDQFVRSRRSMAQISSTHEGQIPPVIPQKRVIIQNSHGEKLVGVLHDTGSKELVILCHGFTSSKEYSTLVNLAAALEKEGISVFRFDFAGNGESEGSFQYGNYRREAEDLHAVVLHFSGAKHLISAILGHSKGGNVVLLYASMYPDVHTVLNVSGRFNLERGIADRLGKNFMERIKKDGFIDVKDNTAYYLNPKYQYSRNLGLDDDLIKAVHTVVEKLEPDADIQSRCIDEMKSFRDGNGSFGRLSATRGRDGANPGKVQYRVTEESLMDRLTTDMRAACLSIQRDCRILTIHGSKDEIVPAEDGLEFAKIIPNHKLHIVEGADHGYTAHQAELTSIVLEFLRAGMQPEKDIPNQVEDANSPRGT